MGKVAKSRRNFGSGDTVGSLATQIQLILKIKQRAEQKIREVVKLPLMMFLIEETRRGAGQPISQDNFYFAKETKAPHLKSSIVGRGTSKPSKRSKL